MAAKHMPSQERLKHLLSYDHDSGDLVWNRRPETDFARSRLCTAWNARFAGKVAGNKLTKCGDRSEIRIKVDGHSHGAHRVIWVMVKGSIPNGREIDHKDLDPWNNRWNNLRLATRAQNMQNIRRHRDSTTGLKGACRCGNKFLAVIHVLGVRHLLGKFDTPEEAHSAYCEAANEHFQEFARTT